MADADPREALERLIRERGEDYASLSRLIGRNPAYVQQYIKRGTPRRLAEEDRRLLARYFGVEESLLGGPPERGRDGDDGLVGVRRLDLGASAGPGALDGDETVRGTMAFDALWLRRLGIASRERLSLIRVQGDSMAPTLNDGDEILVDGGDAGARLRDGIYVLRIDDALVVKRLALSPGRRLAVRSDNEAYPGWPDCDLADVDIVGRVVWVGRTIR
jgi:phage repressor protein C with HTH and peptisase S24 domain